MNYAGHHVTSAVTPTTTNSPLAIGFLWTDTSLPTPTLKICSSVSPVTFVAVGGGGTVADSDVTFTDITTGNASVSAHGFLPKLSGNGYESFRGDGTYKYGVARGVVATTDPFIHSQTWHGAGGSTIFKAWQLNVTQDAGLFDPNNSLLMEVRAGGAGTTQIMKLDTNTGLTLGGQVIAGTYLQFGDTAGIYSFSRASFLTPQDGVWRLGRQNQGATGFLETMAFAPSITAGFGSGATIAGVESTGRITVGTTPGTTGTITFGKTWSHVPVCFVQNETTGLFAICAPTTTKVDISGLTMTAGDTVVFHCFGY